MLRCIIIQNILIITYGYKRNKIVFHETVHKKGGAGGGGDPG